MKTTKSLFYGLLLVTGFAACSKEYNSNPAGNSNAFGGSNPIAPINGAGTDEIVFKENGAVVRITGAKYFDNGNLRIISGVTQEGTKAVGFSFLISPYPSANGIYYGHGKPNDTLSLVKLVGEAADPSGDPQLSYFSGGVTTPNNLQNIGGYSYTKVTDTTGDRMKGEFTGRLVRRDQNDLDKDFSESIEITSGFYNVSKFVP